MPSSPSSASCATRRSRCCGFEAQRQGMGEDGHTARRVGQPGHVGRVDAGLGHISGATVGEVAVEGVVDVLGRTRLHQGPGEVGPAHARLVARLGQDVLVGHARPQLSETDGQLPVAQRPVPAQGDELVLQGPGPGLDEVHEHVHRPGDAGRPRGRRRLAARHLAPRHQPHPELPGDVARLGQPGQAVVVGERHRRATRLGRQLDDPPGDSEPSDTVEWLCRSITGAGYPCPRRGPPPDKGLRGTTVLAANS